MTKAGKSMVAALAALALLGGVSRQANAAQCGNGPAGFEAWKQAFSGEARAKGVGATGISALMGTNYAQATINADRACTVSSCRSIQFLVKRGAAAIVARGKKLKRSQAALFASIEAALRRAAGAADRDLGHGERVRQPARQPEHALLDRHAGLRLPPAGIFHRPALFGAAIDRSRHARRVAARLDAWRDRPDAISAQEHRGLRRRQSRDALRAP